MILGKNNIHSKFYILIIAFITAIPIDLLQDPDNQVGTPISLILIIPAFFSFILIKNEIKKYLVFSIIFSVISICSIQIIYGNFVLRPFFSLAFFFMPSLTFFYARKTFYNYDTFLVFLKYVVYFSIILSWSLVFSILFKHFGEVRTEGTLNGDFFGLTLSGAYGIHSLGCHLFILIFFLQYYLSTNKKINTVIKYLIVISILIYISIVFLSLSRELVLGLTIFYGLFLGNKYGFFKLAIIIVIITLITTSYLSGFLGSLLEVWEFRIDTMLNADNLNDFSSGRLDIQLLALQQILNNPLFATGFQGYSLDFSIRGYNESLDGVSTHIFFLTALWKMGLVSFSFYIIYWAKLLKGVINRSKVVSKQAQLTVSTFIFTILFINLFWDAFLAPGIMISFAFFCGGIISLDKPLPKTTFLRS